MARNKRVDPRLKRRGETHLQWRQRLDRLADAESYGQSLVTSEARQHAEYHTETVVHEEGSMAKVMRNSTRSALARMHQVGQITPEQYEASLEIAAVAETIARAVSVRGASLEARVDNSGSSKDILIERLSRVRLEHTYSRWRMALPRKHAALIVSMILRDSALKAKARMAGMPWYPARQMMKDALDLWSEMKERVWASVDEDDVQRQVYDRLGEGVLH